MSDSGNGWKPLRDDPEGVRALLDAEGVDLLVHGPDGPPGKMFPTLTVAAEEPWSELKAPAVSPFPLEALPPDVALFVEAVATETQTPVDLAAAVALGVMSAAALGAGTVDCGNWEEELGLYLMVALPSGERKSAVLREVCRPLHRLERDWREVAAAELREQRARKDTLENRRTKLVKKAGDADDLADRGELMIELEQLDEELEQLGEPVAPRLLADDATPEMLATLLASHDQLAIFAAEAALIDNLIGRYSEKGSPNLHLVCHAYSAEPTRIDRRNREEWLEAPLLTITLTIQPHVLRSLIEHSAARSQGLVGRFAFVLPESGLGRRETTPPPIPASLRERWADVVRRLFTPHHFSTPEKCGQKGQNPISVLSVRKPLIKKLALSLSPSSQILLSELRAELEPRHLEGGDLRPVADWTARHAGRIARIAGLLHLAEHDADRPITDETMRRSLRIGEYLLEHALAALTTPDEAMRKALRWLARHDKETVTQRDLHRGPMNKRGTAEQAAELAQSLVALDALRLLPPATQDGPGRPPSPSYVINPHLRAQDGHTSARTASR